jgi:hypothetical protein
MSALLSRRAASLLVSLLLLAASASAANWGEPARQLAHKISARTGPGAVAITFKNSSSMSSGDVADARRAVEQSLRSAGLRFVPEDQAAITLRITLSENAQGYLWVAEIRQGKDEPAIVMVEVPHPDLGTAPRTAAAVVVRKQVLWFQAAPILDALVLGGGGSAHLVVLSPDRVSLYKQGSMRWEPEQEMEIHHAGAWPRDLRGRLAARPDHLFDAYLPGMKCWSAGSGPLTLQCRESDEPWPLTVANQPPQMAFFGAQRNFFNGAIRPGFGAARNTAPFYSAAGLPRDNYTLWLFAGVDGALRVTDGVNERVIAPRGWGSDVAAVLNGCGGPQALITAGGDSATPDAVVALDVPEREPTVVSDPLEFGGPITALWSTADGNAVVAVSKNLKTGNYEAYALTVVCGQ